MNGAVSSYGEMGTYLAFVQALITVVLSKPQMKSKNFFEWLFRSDMGGFVMATVGLVLSMIKGAFSDKRTKLFFSALSLVLTTFGFVVAVVKFEPDDETWLGWGEEVFTLSDWVLTAAGFILDSSFLSLPEKPQPPVADQTPCMPGHYQDYWIE